MPTKTIADALTEEPDGHRCPFGQFYDRCTTNDQSGIDDALNKIAAQRATNPDSKRGYTSTWLCSILANYDGPDLGQIRRHLSGNCGCSDNRFRAAEQGELPMGGPA